MKNSREKDDADRSDSDLTDNLYETVRSLIPLYSRSAEDRANSLLACYPDFAKIIEALKTLIDIMLPGRMTSDSVCADDFGLFLTRRLSQAWRMLQPEIEKAIPFRWKSETALDEGPPEEIDPKEESTRILRELLGRMAGIRELVVEDIQAAYDGDPAALSFAEVQLAYPGLLAVASHRLAHPLYQMDVPVIPRIMSEWTHSRTGADIHPGAEIGHGLFIDHATGVVIGETARIGNRVKIYQGVTLGAKSFPLDEEGRPIKHIRRHPTVGDQVIIYANSTILGDIEIGENSTIGGNVFLTESVPPNHFVGAKHAELHIKPEKNKS
ncbi:MAG: serine O-acetyltransferase EpsC [Verrucomicrobiota bacterium]